jgi:hypothetical protein
MLKVTHKREMRASLTRSDSSVDNEPIVAISLSVDHRTALSLLVMSPSIAERRVLLVDSQALRTVL